MTAVAVLAVAGLGLGPGASMAAADEVRTYEGRLGGEWTTVTADCTGDTCVLTLADPWPAARGLWDDPVTVTGGTATLVAPDECGAADGGASNTTTLTLVLDAMTMTATVTEEAGERRKGGIICWSAGGSSRFNATVVTPTTTAVQTPGSTPGPAAGAPGGPGTETETDADVTGGRATTSRLATGAADAPSVLSSLPTVSRLQPGNALVAALVTVVLVLLIAFPTTLLNSAAEQGSDRFSAWWRARRGLAPADAYADTDTDRAGGRPWWWAAGGVLAAGVIASFVDPQFGLNPGSLRTMLSIVTGFGIDVVLGWAVVVLLVRRASPGARPTYTFRAASLLVVVGAVVFSRLTGFEPGIIFGLVAGVGFAALTSERDQARVALVPLGYGVVMALLGWAGYHLVADAQGTVAVFVAETLSAMAVGGLAALPLALLPVPGMTGATIFRWDRRVWAACYAGGLFGFFLVLMPTPYAWGEVGWSLKAWVLGYLAYLVAAVAAWWLTRSRTGSEPVGGLEGVVREDDGRAGPADPDEGLEHDPVAVDPPALGGGLDLRVLPRDLVGGDGDR